MPVLPLKHPLPKVERHRCPVMMKRTILTPDVVGDDDHYGALLQAPLLKTRQGDDSAGHTDESSQGPKRAAKLCHPLSSTADKDVAVAPGCVVEDYWRQHSRYL
jgi:hypothetical protein